MVEEEQYGKRSEGREGVMATEERWRERNNGVGCSVGVGERKQWAGREKIEERALCMINGPHISQGILGVRFPHCIGEEAF